MSLIASVLAATLWATAADQPRVYCDPEEQDAACELTERRRLEAAYRAVPAEQEAGTGAEIYRSFFYDGYGRDLLLISFEARPEQSPIVVVSGRDGRRVQGAVASADWERIRYEGMFADRTLAPLPEATGLDDVLICLHGWGVLVELVNAEDLNGDRRTVRRKVQNTCDRDGMAGRYGFRLAEMALKALPGCAELDAESHRNDVARLDACLYLAGNTVAAASLLNQKGEPPANGYGDVATLEAWRAWLATDSTSRVDWAGEVHVESNRFVPGQPRPPRLADVMFERASVLKDLRIHQVEIGARDDRNGWIKGEVAYRVSGDDEPERLMVADYRQEWSRGNGFGWRLDNWIVGPFRPLVEAE